MDDAAIEIPRDRSTLQNVIGRNSWLPKDIETATQITFLAYATIARSHRGPIKLQ